MSSGQQFHNHYPRREEILPPEKILSHFGLSPGQSLADVGCGGGYFALKAAEIVGSQGVVKAIDINPEKLEFLRQAARERGIADRIEIYLAQGESIPLPDMDVDAALIANVLHEIPDPLNFVRDAVRILKNNGEIWVVEWQKVETPMGPPLSERRSLEEWVEMLEQAGIGVIETRVFSPAHVLLRGRALK